MADEKKRRLEDSDIEVEKPGMKPPGKPPGGKPPDAKKRDADTGDGNDGSAVDLDLAAPDANDNNTDNTGPLP